MLDDMYKRKIDRPTRSASSTSATATGRRSSMPGDGEKVRYLEKREEPAL